MVFSGNAHPALATEISHYLGKRLGGSEVKRFSDGEIALTINESIRGNDIFVVQPTCFPANDNLMELLIYLDACRRSSAKRVTAVIPFYGYARQDKKVGPREPITAKLVSNLITTAGADRVLCLDLHSGQIQGFFDIPVDHLTAKLLFVDYIQKMELKDLVIVAPDAGAAKQATRIANMIHAGVAIVNKLRPKPNVAVAQSIIGNVQGSDVIIMDDIIDTAGTVQATSELLEKEGARSIRFCATHGILSEPALERIQHSALKEVVVTNSIPMGGKAERCKKLKVLSIAPLMGEAIKRIHNGESVSELFEEHIPERKPITEFEAKKT